MAVLLEALLLLAPSQVFPDAEELGVREQEHGLGVLREHLEEFNPNEGVPILVAFEGLIHFGLEGYILLGAPEPLAASVVLPVPFGDAEPVTIIPES
jgi:hypothetical protein